MPQNLPQLALHLSNISQVHNGLFKFLLDLKKEKKVLIVDASQGGTTIALYMSMENLVCLCKSLNDAKAITHRLTNLKIINVNLIVGDLDNLPFQNNTFDLICLHKLDHFINFSTESKYNLAEISDNIKRVLDNDGICYASYAFPSDTSPIKRLFPESLTNLTNHGKKMSDIACLYHYESLENPSLIKICYYRNLFKSKSYFFQIKRRLFGNNFGFIKIKSPKVLNDRLNFIQELCHELKDKLGLQLSSPDIVRGGSGGSAVLDYGQAIIRLPLNETGLHRCRNNYTSLEKLQNIHLGIMIPKPLMQGCLHGQHYFAESKIFGISMDLNKLSSKNYDKIHDESYDLLINKSLITLGYMNSHYYKSIVEQEFEDITPFISSEDIFILNEVMDLMKDNFISQRIPVVIQHGDFKSTNFIASRGFRKKLRGIIDWDMARIPGLPLIDLFTMIIYKNSAKLSTFVKEIWPLSMVINKNNYIRNYLSKFRISINSSKLIALFAVIRYLNRYYHVEEIKRHPDWYEEMIKKCLIPYCIQCLSNEE